MCEFALPKTEVEWLMLSVARLHIDESVAIASEARYTRSQKEKITQ